MGKGKALHWDSIMVTNGSALHRRVEMRLVPSSSYRGLLPGLISELTLLAPASYEYNPVHCP